MGWWRPKEQYADIPPDLRQEFEKFGESILAHAIGSGQHSEPFPELGPLLKNKRHRAHLRNWLSEKRYLAERRDKITVIAAVAALLLRSLQD